jgi:predicted ATPase/DNA-binding CsgD family transcriptional regulator
VTEGTLPIALSSLIGRHREIEALTKLLAGARMVTIVGSGGAGKTRLALAVAARASARFPDGVWWADLASLGEAELLPGVVASALDVPQSPGEDPMPVIARHIKQNVTLLVLDSCEHLVEESAELAERLLRSGPGVKVLATSREVIGASGERVYRVNGLDLPGPGDDPQASEAVQLFAERAGQTVAGLSLDPAQLESVARLCHRLDGIPLAIELAAARVGTLSIEEIAARLDDNPDLLRHPSRTAPARHQTLQATLEWSYRLLTPAEQVLFHRLSAFAGTFSLLAAEAVGRGGDIERTDVVSLLGSLVDKSLVQVADRGAEHRYRLLATVRQHGEAKLAASGELPAVFQAHARFYLGLAEQAGAGLEGPDQARWLDRLELEHENLRAVLQRELPAEPEVGGRLAGLLWPFWYRRGHYHEARSWLEQAARLSAEMSPDVRADVLAGAGFLAFLQCDYEVATQRLSQVRALREELDDQVGAAEALQRLGSIAREQGRYDEARRLHEASMAAWASLEEPAGVAASEDYLGFVAWLDGDFAGAAEHSARAAAYFKAAGRRQETASALINLGAAARYAGDAQAAAERLTEALTISRELGYTEGVAWALAELGAVTAASGGAGGGAGGAGTGGQEMLREALRIHFQLGDRWRVASVLEAIAATMAEAEPGTAATLLSVAGALRRHLGTPVPPAERPAVAAALAGAERAAGPGVFSRAWASGQSMSLPDAVELACQHASVRSAAAPARADGLGADLTERELAVLRLISQGLTNREIGTRLFISAGTAGVHVSNILRKLDVSSRVQAAGIARELGL